MVNKETCLVIIMMIGLVLGGFALVEYVTPASQFVPLCYQPRPSESPQFVAQDKDGLFHIGALLGPTGL